jgi:type II secretory pathway component PulK
MSVSRPGFALLATLVALATASIAAMAISMNARTSVSLVQGEINEARLRQAIEGAAVRAAAQLMEEDSPPAALDGRVFVSYMIGGIQVEVQLLAESARFDVNAGDINQFTALLVELGTPAGGAALIGRRLADRRGEGQPIALVAETRDLFGDNDVLFRAVAPYLTVNGAAQIDVRFAPQAILNSTTLDAGRLADVVRARRDPAPTDTNGPLLAIGPQGDAQIAFIMTARTPNGAQRRQEQIIRIYNGKMFCLERREGNPQIPRLGML